MLQELDRALCACYDCAFLDLDGVVYIGTESVPEAPRHLRDARAAGMRLAFVTNNASRTPAQVAGHLRSLGVPAVPEEVVTSAQAAARLVAESVPRPGPVFVIGGSGVVAALDEVGLRATGDIDDEPLAAVSGYAPELAWRRVVDGAILVRRGLPWVATNTDPTLPTAHGLGPGNGVLVGVVSAFAETEPVVAGKPEAPLFTETLTRTGARRPLVVGDRLGTDVAGASRCGLDTLLVLTGVTGLEELVRAAPSERPTYLAADLAGLCSPHRAPARSPGHQWECGGWRTGVEDGGLRVWGEGGTEDWWRVVAAAAWDWLDDTGTPVDTRGLHPPGNVRHRSFSAGHTRTGDGGEGR